MTSRDFQSYLDQPRKLLLLPITDLQELALRYPYSQHIRLMLLLKAHLEGHPEEEAYLYRCAAANFDRAHVYELLQELEAELSDEVLDDETETLELRELDQLLAEEQPLTTPSPPSALSALPEDLPVREVNTGLEPLPGQAAGSVPTRNELNLAVFIDRWADRASAFSGLLSASGRQAEPTSTAPVVPQRPELFTQAGSQKPTPDLRQRLNRIRQRQARNAATSGESVTRIARKSLVAQDDTASETLARLLVRQGQFQNAIKMYRRLMLLYPEKKTIFAGLINDLKEKL